MTEAGGDDMDRDSGEQQGCRVQVPQGVDKARPGTRAANLRMQHLPEEAGKGFFPPLI